MPHLVRGVSWSTATSTYIHCVAYIWIAAKTIHMFNAYLKILSVDQTGWFVIIVYETCHQIQSLLSNETWTNKRATPPRTWGKEQFGTSDIPHKTNAFSGADLSRCPCCGAGAGAGGGAAGGAAGGGWWWLVVVVAIPSLVFSPPIDWLHRDRHLRTSRAIELTTAGDAWSNS